jgi:hypothetical protein
MKELDLFFLKKCEELETELDKEFDHSPPTSTSKLLQKARDTTDVSFEEIRTEEKSEEVWNSLKEEIMRIVSQEKREEHQSRRLARVRIVWRNILDRYRNPDNDVGFVRVVFSAIEPL